MTSREPYSRVVPIIYVNSSSLKGLERFVKSSAATQPESSSKPSPCADNSKPLALFVEDDDATRKAVRGFLNAEGYDVVEAANGAEGLAALNDGLCPDIILLDLLMPVMDGAKFHAALRAHPTCSEVPVILVTGAPEARPSGIDAVITKPFDFEHLIRVVRELSPERERTRRVLVVEDEADVRESTRELLELSGYVVETAEDGQAALELISAGSPPDVILTDLMMPRLNGIELIHALRQRPELLDVPVIVVSAATGSISNSLDVDGVIAKPLDMPRLLSFVRNARKKRRVRAPLESTAVAPRRPSPNVQKKVDELTENQGRVRFFAAVAHELRGPLQSISSSQQLMAMSPAIGPKERAYLGTMTRGTRRLARLVEDLLDFLRADATGFFKVNCFSCDLGQTCATVVEELAEAHPGRSIQLTVDGDTRGQFDDMRIGQVVTNLVTNALKYGAPTTPVRVSLADAGESVVLQVRNAGNPIPEVALVTLFDPFKRAVAQNDARPGLGLGLAIVRQISFAHGGAVDVESNEQETTFSVVLPKAQPD